MPIATTDRIIALLTVLNPADVEALPPAQRRRLAEHCRRCADLAEPRAEAPKAGVLAQLHKGSPRWE